MRIITSYLKKYVMFTSDMRDEGSQNKSMSGVGVKAPGQSNQPNPETPTPPHMSDARATKWQDTTNGEEEPRRIPDVSLEIKWNIIDKFEWYK